ncbi:MAG: c-type cytochrome [Acidobacteria bacterium]|nr:c-type cytochrome [Acidobacteriota bacterium]
MTIRRQLKLLSLVSFSLGWCLLQPLEVSQAMPVFMDLYDADPATRPESRGKCSVCHVSEDSGVRTEFGKAFIKGGYRLTPELRKLFPDLFVQQGEVAVAAAAPAGFNSQHYFEGNCAACHGDDGKGVAPGAPDFTDTAWHRGHADDDPLTEVIHSGRGIMPPFKDRLKKEEIKVLVTYVRKFAVN